MPSLYEDRKNFNDFMNDVMEDFESIVKYHPDARSILHQIYFGIHHNRWDSKGYFDIGPHGKHNIRISSFEYAEMHYCDAERRDHFYDAYELENEVIESSRWNSDILTHIFEYVSVNCYLQRYKVKIINENEEEIISFPHIFSLDTEISKNQFHDFILQQIIIYTSHLIKPYSTLIPYIKGIIESFDNHYIANGYFIELMKINKIKNVEYDQMEDHYETIFECVIELFRNRRTHIDGSVFQDRYELIIKIHQDSDGFPFRILFHESDQPQPHEMVGKVEDFNGKQKPFIQHRKIHQCINDLISIWMEEHE
jgi:hypothetical protein